MIIENGRFYFINDKFMKKYGSKYNLMKNRETGNKRPCYFCFKDEINTDIIWFIPISKQYQKYRDIYNKKKLKIHKEPFNFVFGIVKDEKAVFLIQNMFPTTIEYIEEKYQVKSNDVTIAMPLQKEIIDKAKSILRLELKGVRVAFSNPIEFKQELLNNENIK